jgi:biotin carboxylase
VLEIARSEGIDGVIAACTDVAVPTAAFLAQELGLAGPPLQSARIACSKTLFRRFLTEHGFPVPRSLPIDSGSDPGTGIFEGERWIMKPDDSSGSKGIFIVCSRAEFLERLPETLSFSPTGTGILESYIDGHQGTCEGVLRRGKIELACILDRATADPPFVATRGHLLPTRLSEGLKQTLLVSLGSAWRLLGITEGPFDCDFVAADDGIYLIEISPRLGGNCISSLVRIAMGFDIVEHSIRQALGEDPPLPAGPRIRPAATVILGVTGTGLLRFDRIEAELLRQETWVNSLSLDVDYGARVRPFINGRHRIGEAIILGEDRLEVETHIAELYRRLHLRAETT